MTHGVMVALQILVLSVKVRILMGQHRSASADLFYYAFFRANGCDRHSVRKMSYIDSDSYRDHRIRPLTLAAIIVDNPDLNLIKR